MATEVVLAIVGVLATLAAGLIWVVKYLADSLTRDLKEHTKASVELKTYLKDRNGRDAEQHLETIKAMLKLTKTVNGFPTTMQKIADASIRKLKQQTVKEQHVEHQHIEKQEP